MDVAGLWRYPVKSLQGEPVETLTVQVDGVVGDRTWGIRDEATGRILTARRRPAMLAAAAVDDGGTPVITLPDGTQLAGPGRSTDRVLSDWLGGAVSLVSSTGRSGRAEFFADATDDTSRAIEFKMPEGRYVDAAPLLVLTTASLRAAAALHPTGAWDARRFRPNVLLDIEGDGWVEDDWIGRQVTLGTARLVPSEQCVRCTMVTREQPGLPEDRDVFRTLARHHAGRFGVWSDVLEPGVVDLGDPAVLVAARA